VRFRWGYDCQKRVVCRTPIHFLSEYARYIFLPFVTNLQKNENVVFCAQKTRL